MEKEGLKVAPSTTKKLRHMFEKEQSGLLWKILAYSGKTKPKIRESERARRSLGLVCRKEEMMPLKDQVHLWDRIFYAKFAPGTEMREMLIERSFGDKYLVEMGGVGKGDFWSGVLKTDGTGMDGFNFMGKMLMRHVKMIGDEIY